MKKVIRIFKALSDPNRLRILKMLERRSLCLCEISAVLNLAPSTVSKHLSILREADLISDHKEGKWVNFHLNKDTSQRYAREMLAFLETNLPDDDIILRDAKRVQTVDRVAICCKNGKHQHELA
jgi:ArsR family transcriptional regulator